MVVGGHVAWQFSVMFEENLNEYACGWRFDLYGGMMPCLAAGVDVCYSSVLS